jgi:Ca-activated chloride channel family protein
MKKILLLIILFCSLTGYGQTAVESILRGNQFYQESQFEQAEAQYRQALEYDPNNEKAKYNLANALQKQKKYQEAVSILGELGQTSKDPAIKSAAYYNQGVAHSQMKNLEESIESYKKSLRLNPGDKEARENLEKALLAQKNKQKQKNQQDKQKNPNMSQKEAEQKLKMLQQKEKELHQRKDKQNQGSGQSQDW